jgi:FtsP/CotA-like multicopper oxidase with cupredoxin domain
MEHFEETEQVSSLKVRRSRRRPKARWLAVLGAGAITAMFLPLGSSTPGHAASEPAEGLLCKSNATSSFVLTAKSGYILTPDNNSVYMWSYSAGSDPFQFPGAVLCVPEGAHVTITLKNALKVPTSIMFPGITGVEADGSAANPEAATGSLTKSAPANGGSVTYTFVADHAGTYLYESGTNTQLQAQMGLVGALIVRPAGFDPAKPHVYNLPGAIPDLDTRYKPGKEFLNLFSELDPDLHQKVEFAPDQATYVVDWTTYRVRYWMINGRVFPDTIGANNSQSLPSQPYSALVHIQPRVTTGSDNLACAMPGEPTLSADPACNPAPALVRMLNAGARTYPFHPHGNHDKLIGIDARPLRSTDGQLDFTRDEFSRVMVPGQTSEVLVTWVDAQGFSSSDIGVPVPPDLGRENGAYWSGSPYLGQKRAPKAFELQLNECGEYYHMAHSHALYQVATYSASGSGMLTFTRIDPSAPNDTNCHPAGGQ